MRQPTEVRLPVAVRVYGVCFGFVWVGFLSVAIVKSSPAVVPIAISMAILGCAFIYRLDSMKIVANESGLFVRNFYRTWRFDWNEVDDFRVGRWMMAPFGRVIHILLRNDEVVTVDVTARPWVFLGGRAKLRETLQELRSWLPTSGPAI